MNDPSSDSSASPQFFTTRWSQVLLAVESDSPDSSEALEALCRAYWFPLYAFARRQGRGAHDAQDLTQEFFARLLEKDWLRLADRKMGRFRTFLLVIFKRFLANEWDKERALKRGGGQAPVPLDTTIAESRLAADPGASLSADRDYERRWARALLDQSIADLRAEFEKKGQADQFEALKGYLTADRGDIPYENVAVVLNQSTAGARSAVHRLRKRFRELFRQQITNTVSDPGDVDDEVRQVVAALSWE